jgi:hypothetical protein
MELVAILQVLWQRRVLIAVGAVVAVAVAALGARSESAAVTGAVASGKVLFDTADSQLVEAAPKEGATTPMRAFLLGELVAGDEGRAIVARRAGVPTRELTVIGPSASLQPPLETPLAKQVRAATVAPTTSNVVRVFTDTVSPILAIEASAPDGRRAQALVDATANSLAALAAQHDATASHGFVTEVVASPRVRETVSASHRAVFAVVAAIALFALWCAAIVVAWGIAGRGARPAVAASRA